MATPTKLRVPAAWRIREPRSGLVRIPFVSRCRMEGIRHTADGLICDLSAAGLFVAMEPVPAPAEHFRVSFALPGDEPVEVDAMVMWRNAGASPRMPDLPTGCGLRFLALPPEARGRIETLVKAYTVMQPVVAQPA